jgi:hypothetical protein
VYHLLIRLFDLSIGEASHVQELLHVGVTSDIPLDSLKMFISLLPIAEKALEHCLGNLLEEATERIR